jgi:hypothetical protein
MVADPASPATAAPPVGGYTVRDMTEDASGRLTVELTIEEAKLIVAALRQFSPSWPHDMDDMSRAELLDGIRRGIEHVVSQLGPEHASTS